MALIDILKYINFDEFTEQQKAELKKKFQQRKQELRAATNAVDRGLNALARKPKRKRAAKQQTAGRPAKR